MSGKSLETARSEAVAQALEGEQDEPLGFLVHEVANAISQAYGALMAPIGLTRPQMRVLIWVERRPGISQAKLSELLGISAMAMTGLLDRMEAKNLVRRQEDPHGRAESPGSGYLRRRSTLPSGSQTAAGHEASGFHGRDGGQEPGYRVLEVDVAFLSRTGRATCSARSD